MKQTVNSNITIGIKARKGTGSILKKISLDRMRNESLEQVIPELVRMYCRTRMLSARK